jgi:hypothetical protein
MPELVARFEFATDRLQTNPDFISATEVTTPRDAYPVAYGIDSTDTKELSISGN